MAQLPEPLALGDVHDVEGYVRGIVATLGIADSDEFEELVADGFELVSAKHAQLPAGASLGRALSGWLASRLRDRWRERHSEWRRDTRGGRAYALPVPTGLALEQGEKDALVAPNGWDVVESRLALASVFEQESDLRDPRRVGRYRGMPSVGALATGTAREIWATIVEERRLIADRGASQPPPFTFVAGI